jgi:hypothetical protein
MSSVRSWHVTGGMSSEIPDINPQNSMEAFVSWLRNDETPLLYKIGAIALPVILGYAIGVLIGYPLLIAACVTLTFGSLAYSALRALEGRVETARERTEFNLLCARNAATALTNMKNAVGGEEAFNALPELNLGDRTGSTGYIDFLEYEDLSHSVMRGVDAGGRPFISLKVQSNIANARPFVITLFQRYAQGGEWSYGSTFGDRFFNDRLRAEDHTAIHQIVVERNHPTLQLV